MIVMLAPVSMMHLVCFGELNNRAWISRLSASQEKICCDFVVWCLLCGRPSFLISFLVFFCICVCYVTGFGIWYNIFRVVEVWYSCYYRTSLVFVVCMVVASTSWLDKVYNMKRDLWLVFVLSLIHI